MAAHMHIESIEEMERAGAFDSKETAQLACINIHDKLKRTHADNATLNAELVEERLRNGSLSVELDHMKREQHKCKTDLMIQIAIGEELTQQNQEIRTRLNGYAEELDKQVTRGDRLSQENHRMQKDLQEQVARGIILGHENEEMRIRLNDHDKKIFEMFRRWEERENSFTDDSAELDYSILWETSASQHQKRTRVASDNISIASELSSECVTSECDTVTYRQRSVPPSLPARNKMTLPKDVHPSGDIASSSDDDVTKERKKKKSVFSKSLTSIKSVFHRQ